jgi:hypothetical protein
MQITFLMIKYEFTSPLDGSYFSDFTKFLDTETDEEGQTISIEFLSKSAELVDSLLEHRPYPIMTNQKIYVNPTSPTECYAGLGFVDFNNYENIFKASTYYNDFQTAFASLRNKFQIEEVETRQAVVEVEWFDDSQLYLGLPVNWLEANELFNSVA